MLRYCWRALVSRPLPNYDGAVDEVTRMTWAIAHAGGGGNALTWATANSVGATWTGADWTERYDSNVGQEAPVPARPIGLPIASRGQEAAHIELRVTIILLVVLPALTVGIALVDAYLGLS